MVLGKTKAKSIASRPGLYDILNEVVQAKEK